MLINATLPEEDRVAIVDDGVLTELDIEIAERQQTKSNIYLGEVIRVEQGLQAAFVDYGASRPGFLQIGEIHPSLYPLQDDGSPTTKRVPINQILKRGQQILVQVVKEERGNKGAAITTEISLPGRYMVLMPESNSRGISRKIENESVRKGIKQAIAGLELPDNMGYIIRTAAIDQPPEELKRDFDYLLSTYNSIISHSKTAKAPTLIYQESNLVIRSIRDYFSPEIDEVLIDDRKVFQEARDFFKAVMPEYVSLVKLHQERRPIFARYQVEEQIAQLSSNTVNLPSGGSIVLDQTEALVAIDVNSGKMASEQDVEATASRVNIEAATEIARQLRLRDMGGLIVIDFIDMRQRKNAREVEKTLKTGLKIDKARVTVGRISHQFGLLEMSRQRIKGNLGEGAYHQCPHCQGTGRIKGAESRSVALLRQIQAGTAKGNIDLVSCTAAVDVTNYILNNKRIELIDLEQRHNLKIRINADPSYLPEQTDLEFIKQSKELHNGASAQTALVDIDVSERGQTNDVDSDNDLEVSENASAKVIESDTDIQSEETASANDKKRPRRRRRPNRRRTENNSTDEQRTTETLGAEPALAQQPLDTVSDVVSSVETQITTTADQPLAAVSAPAENIEAAPEAKKPAKRRRTTNKRTTTTATNTPTQTETTEPTMQPAPQTNSAGKPENTPVDNKAPEVTTISNINIPALPTEQQGSPVDATEQSNEVKKPVRRRRSSKKTDSTADPTANLSPTPAVEDVSQAEEKAPTNTTVRKKTTTSTTLQKTSDTTDAMVEGSTPIIEKKPVRRRRVVKIKAPETTDEAVIADTVPTNSTDKKPAKPKTRTATRKSTPTKALDADSANETQTAANMDEQQSTEKKPVRRRRTTKKPVQDAVTEDK